MLSKNKETKINIKSRAIDLSKLRKNWDYEIISHDVFDREGNEYMDIEEAKQNGLKEYMLLIHEDEKPEFTNIALRYETDDSIKINTKNAKMCDMGILIMLRGEFKGMEFMFPLMQLDLFSQIFAYGYLTHGHIDKKMVRKIHKDINKGYILRRYLGASIANFILYGR
jgi:hypothetical protein